MTTIEQSARSEAPAATVFGLLKDGDTWPEWSMFTAFRLERPGRDEPMGVGAIRVFSTSVSTAREEVTALAQDRRLDYRLLSGLPLRDYHAEVELEPLAAGGTLIRWRASFGPQAFGTGWFWKLFMERVIARTVRDLAVGAARKSGSR